MIFHCFRLEWADFVLGVDVVARLDVAVAEAAAADVKGAGVEEPAVRVNVPSSLAW